MPFPTALIAEYVGHADQRAAAAVYIGTFVVLAVLFNLLWRYAAHWSGSLHPQADRDAVDKLTRQYRFGPLFYVAAFVLIWVNVHVALFLTLLIAVFFALPDAERLRARGRGDTSV